MPLPVPDGEPMAFPGVEAASGVPTAHTRDGGGADRRARQGFPHQLSQAVGRALVFSAMSAPRVPCHRPAGGEMPQRTRLPPHPEEGLSWPPLSYWFRYTLVGFL